MAILSLRAVPTLPRGWHRAPNPAPAAAPLAAPRAQGGVVLPHLDLPDSGGLIPCAIEDTAIREQAHGESGLRPDVVMHLCHGKSAGRSRPPRRPTPGAAPLPLPARASAVPQCLHGAHPHAGLRSGYGEGRDARGWRPSSPPTPPSELSMSSSSSYFTVSPLVELLCPQPSSHRAKHSSTHASKCEPRSPSLATWDTECWEGEEARKDKRERKRAGPIAFFFGFNWTH